MSTSMHSSRDVIIRTEDFAGAQRFYAEAFGFVAQACGASMVGYDTGAMRLYLEQGPAHGPVFDFLVPDVAAAKQRLVAAGCVVIEEDPAVPRCYLRDPYGMTFNVGRAAGWEPSE